MAEAMEKPEEEAGVGPSTAFMAGVRCTLKAEPTAVSEERLLQMESVTKGQVATGAGSGGQRELQLHPGLKVPIGPPST